jgi:hypothetical protein
MANEGAAHLTRLDDLQETSGLIMRNLGQQLIFEELSSGQSPDSEGRAAIRVCEKLRRPLCIYAGVGGYRSLMRRALSLARTKHVSLVGAQVDSDGSFILSPEMEKHLDSAEAAQSGEALVAQFLELLMTFIGESLTRMIVQDVWPELGRKPKRTNENRNEK